MAFVGSTTLDVADMALDVADMALDVESEEFVILLLLFLCPSFPAVPL